MGRGSITLYIMIIAGMGIVLSGWWYRNICKCILDLRVFASYIKYLWMENA